MQRTIFTIATLLAFAVLGTAQAHPIQDKYPGRYQDIGNIDNDYPQDDGEDTLDGITSVARHNDMSLAGEGIDQTKVPKVISVEFQHKHKALYVRTGYDKGYGNGFTKCLRFAYYSYRCISKIPSPNKSAFENVIQAVNVINNDVYVNLFFVRPNYEGEIGIRYSADPTEHY